MEISAIKTRILNPPRDNLLSAITTALSEIRENTILCIASKIVAIGEGRCVPKAQVKEKDKLIISEADLYLPRNYTPNSWILHTITHGTLIPSAGIDESNANGHYILWPKDPDKSAKDLWVKLTQHYKLKSLGMVITDSRSVPLRRGLVGFCLAYYGFKPLKDYREQKDIFGKTLKVSMANIPDSLAAVAVFAMGEGSEQTPIVLISGAQKIAFTSKEYKPKKLYSSFSVPLNEDLFSPFITSVPWKKGGRVKTNSSPNGRT